MVSKMKKLVSSLHSSLSFNEWLRFAFVFPQYAKDQRYTTDCADGVATHDHQSLAAVPATVLSSVQHLAEQSSVIGIDEGQFVHGRLFL